MLKIPSTSSMTVPRVVIPPRPSSSSSFSSSMFPQAYSSYPIHPSTTTIYPTPEKTPSTKPNKYTKAGRRAIRQSQKAARVASSSSESLPLSQSHHHHHHHHQRQRSNIGPGLVASSSSTSTLSSSSSLLSLVDSDVDIEDDVLPQVPMVSSSQSSHDQTQTQLWLHNVPRDVSIAA